LRKATDAGAAEGKCVRESQNLRYGHTFAVGGKKAWYEARKCLQ